MSKMNIRQTDVSIGGNQYISGGDINLGIAHSKADVLPLLEKLQAEFRAFADRTELDEETAIEVESKLKLATAEAKKDQPSKQTLLDRLGKAKALLEGIAAAGGMITAIATAAETIHKLF
jgi:hypothetical protein